MQINVLKQKTLPLLLTIALLVTVFLRVGTSENHLKTLRIGLDYWSGFDVILYAQDAGIFQQRGLQVELLRFENLQDIARAVMRGALDAGFVSLWDALQTDPGNDRPSFLLVTDVSKGSDGIVAQRDITSVAELKGKRIGAKLGTVNHLILLEALALHQVQPDTVDIADVSNDEAVKQLKLGELDAAVVWEPLLSETARGIPGKIVHTTRELESIVIDGLMSTASSGRKKKAELHQFVLAWFDVMHALETEPMTVFRAVSAQIGQDAETFARDYAGLQPGDLGLNHQMFVRGRLKSATRKMKAILQLDSRHGRPIRNDLQIEDKSIAKILKEWEPKRS